MKFLQEDLEGCGHLGDADETGDAGAARQGMHFAVEFEEMGEPAGVILGLAEILEGLSDGGEGFVFGFQEGVGQFRLESGVVRG